MVRQLKSIKDLDLTPVGSVFPSPSDWRDLVIYFLMVDRFDDGNLDTPAYSPELSGGGRDRSQATIFQGGNIKGIIRRLDYIKNLGCNAILITPILKTWPGKEDEYHGYGTQDFLMVNPRFGTIEDFQRLVREAHSRGMYVILDIVINHTGDCWGYPGDEVLPFNLEGRYDFGFWRTRSKGDLDAGDEFGEGEDFVSRPGMSSIDEFEEAEEFDEDEAVWPAELQNPDFFKRRGRIREDMGNAGDEEILGGDFVYYKKLDLDSIDVLSAMTEIYKHWIAIADIDGFRMDSAKHIGPVPIADFCNAIKEYAVEHWKAQLPDIRRGFERRDGDRQLHRQEGQRRADKR